MKTMFETSGSINKITFEAGRGVSVSGMINYLGGFTREQVREAVLRGILNFAPSESNKDGYWNEEYSSFYRHAEFIASSSVK